MNVGTVKWFDHRKGFGFIISPEGDDVMVHYAVIVGEGFRILHQGELVEYEAANGPKGWRATVVRQLSRSADIGQPAGVSRNTKLASVG